MRKALIEIAGAPADAEYVTVGRKTVCLNGADAGLLCAAKEILCEMDLEAAANAEGLTFAGCDPNATFGTLAPRPLL